jgi:septal ring factor EnvC (AmiA/AmiB activator)
VLHGMASYLHLQPPLLQVSAAKSAVDQEKGARLDEISAIVTQINEKIRAKKSVLAPKIKELRERRAELDELLLVHGESQQSYDAALDKQGAQLADLERSVGELERTVGEVRAVRAFLAQQCSSECRQKLDAVALLFVRVLTSTLPVRCSVIQEERRLRIVHAVQAEAHYTEAFPLERVHKAAASHSTGTLLCKMQSLGKQCVKRSV